MAVSTIKASGGDYSSLNAWEADKQAVLSAPEEAECYDFLDTSEAAIIGWTTSAANYIRIYTPAAERHNGTSRDVSGSGYQLANGTTAGVLRIGEEYVRLEGLNVKSTDTGGSEALHFPAALNASNDVRVSECIFQDSKSTSGTTYTIQATQANLNLQFRNNIIYGKQRGIDTRNSASVDMDYCIFFTDASDLGIVADTELTCNNTYVGGFSNQDYWTGGSAPGGTHNAASDTSVETDYTSTVASAAAADQFVNASVGSSADFHLKAGSDLEAQGTNVSGITTDIDGDTRDGSTPDIGADELVSAAASLIYRPNPIRTHLTM